MRTAAVLLVAATLAAATSPPNIVFILTDDQDLVLGSMSVMPQTRAALVEGGTMFPVAAPSVPVCCPSRSSLVTGQYQHNTLALNNSIPGNCAGEAWREGPEQFNFGARLAARGYLTQYIGKYLNQYGMPAAGGLEHIPAGWERAQGAAIGGWFGLKGNSKYLNYTLSNQGVAEAHGADFAADYLPTLIHNRTVSFIKYAVSQNKPFFAVASTPSCHQAAIPEPKYAQLLPNATAPRVPNYRVPNADSHWLAREQDYTKMDENAAEWVDLLARRRLLTLLTIDDMVGDVVATLEALGVADNTYIFYTSDHGYHLGNLGLALDKREMYTTDTLVPFFVRGPGVPKNLSVDAIVSHVDIAPTFDDIASASALPGLANAPPFDGESLLPKLRAAKFLQDAGKTHPFPTHSKALSTALSTALHTALPRSVRFSDIPGATVRNHVGVSYHGEHNGAGYNPHDPICPKADPALNCYPQQQYVEPPLFSGHPFCSCQDTTNNTYDMVFFHDPSLQLSASFARFNDSQTFLEAYDLATDPWNLNNTAPTLSPLRKQFFLQAIQDFVTCAGETCGRSSFPKQFQ